MNFAIVDKLHDGAIHSGVTKLPVNFAYKSVSCNLLICSVIILALHIHACDAVTSASTVSV